MGCFWCAEATFEGIPGVISVTSGYCGGDETNPTYEQVSAGRTGHRESIDVLYDPGRISYARLLEIFWHNVDPTQTDGQFCDHGAQYRSAIFYRGEGQRRIAEESRARLVASRRFRKPIVTDLLPFKIFWPAEEYHQDYYKKNPVEYHAYRQGCGRDRRLRELWAQRPLHTEPPAQGGGSPSPAGPASAARQSTPTPPSNVKLANAGPRATSVNPNAAWSAMLAAFRAFAT
jgi:methionine-S-sulfoxide reductase